MLPTRGRFGGIVMSVEQVQLVLEKLVSDGQARDNFRTDRDRFLSDFELSTAELIIFRDLDVGCLKSTAAFLDKFSDAEVSIGSVWIKE
jgi:hypothetical protein